MADVSGLTPADGKLELLAQSREVRYEHKAIFAKVGVRPKADLKTGPAVIG